MKTTTNTNGGKEQGSDSAQKKGGSASTTMTIAQVKAEREKAREAGYQETGAGGS